VYRQARKRVGREKRRANGFLQQEFKVFDQMSVEIIDS
jgi:hypothetical protein